jgi:NitT/TauT family transport system ATP-binding protein
MKGIFFVTHNIEEAALMADRIIIFDHNPGRIRADIRVSTPLPRDPQSFHFRKLIDDIYTLMTTREKGMKIKPHEPSEGFVPLDHFHRLPSVGTAEITGFIEQMLYYEKEHNITGAIDLPALSDEFNMDSDELFPLIEALEILRFARISKGDILVTQEGRDFDSADMLSRKQIFARQLINHVPLAQHIRHALDIQEHHKENEEHFLNELEEKLSKTEADRVLRVIIDWGRYAEIFAYDYDSGMLSLENP